MLIELLNIHEMKNIELITKKGLKLSGWENGIDSKKIILLIHGFGEHIERYKHVFQFFGDNNFKVIGFDLRGHGSSDGRKGHIRKYSQLLDDLEDTIDFLRSSYSPEKLILYGHSTGGALVLNYLLSRKNNINLAVITSPWIDLYIQPRLYPLAKVVSKILPAFSSKTNLTPEMLMTNEEFKSQYLIDSKLTKSISASALVEFIKNGKLIKENIQNLNTKSLIMHGTDDKITKFESSYELSKKNNLITFKKWYGYKHELHNETDWQIVVKFILNWIEKSI